MNSCPSPEMNAMRTGPSAPASSAMPASLSGGSAIGAGANSVIAARGAVTPARYASTRLPGKALADLDGRPMIEHVYRRVSAARGLSEVIVATDDLRIATRVKSFGGKVRLTKATHASGTDRLAEVVASMDCDVVVNVQGDEPLIDPRAIDELIAPFAADPSVQMTTLFRRIQDPSELNNTNITKVVVDRGGVAPYFSRAARPVCPGAPGVCPALHWQYGPFACRRGGLRVPDGLCPTTRGSGEDI